MGEVDVRNLPKDRLSTTDSEGGRLWLYVADVKGKWRNRRTLLGWMLIAFFLFLPWLRVDGRPLLLVDVVNRNFVIFGKSFFAHDAPFLLFLLAGLVLSISLVTSVWGRVWCGWACPQTVFIDNVFRKIEQLIEGDSVTRRLRDRGKLSAEGLIKKCAKWTLFAIIAGVISHSFIALFVGTDALAQMMRQSPAENPRTFFVMIGITGAILFNFAWFREQFCTVLCPYGRFQSVLMGRNSLQVEFQKSREEDCVQCFRCVQVCPTGIDIRRGLQMECVACTACVDACDEVMKRVRKPNGLIRYASGEKSTKLGSRSIVYFVLLSGVIASLGFIISTRAPLNAVWVRAIGNPYEQVKTSDNADLIVNRFRVEISSQSHESFNLRLSAQANDGNSGIRVVTAGNSVELLGGARIHKDVFVEFPRSVLKAGKSTATVFIQSAEGNTLSQNEITLVGPY